MSRGTTSSKETRGKRAGECTLRDSAIQDIVNDVIERDPRLNGLDCTAIVKGGIVHVSGTAPEHSDRDHLRRMLARLRGVDAVWDTVKIERGDELRVVDLGCGDTKQFENAIGIDAWRRPGVDIVADMEDGLPFADGEIDCVFAVHFLEHVRNLVGLMNEIHRVLKPGGALHAMVPKASHVNAIADPTHVRYFHRQTFRYFCEAHPGTRLFRPICVACTEENVLADLQPVHAGPERDHPRDLALFFS